MGRKPIQATLYSILGIKINLGPVFIDNQVSLTDPNTKMKISSRPGWMSEVLEYQSKMTTSDIAQIASLNQVSIILFSIFSPSLFNCNTY